jgi:cytochrome b subunit of formate dehydrogenase
MAEQKEVYSRFSISERLEHWLMMLSFVTLAATGLPQRYALSAVSDAIIGGLGGIETVRIIHRIAATVFLSVTLWHFVAVAYRVYVLRTRLTMLPTLKDVTDFLDAIRYNVGMARQSPRFPRFNFAEKIEYWAVIWGAVLMGLTGSMLWNPIATTHLLPGVVIPAAKAAHSAEAVLAVLAVVIWHFYWVHIRTFNKAIFTGKLTAEQMRDEHAGELAELEAGVLQAPVSRETKRRRERVFLPVSTAFVLVAIVAGYSFISFEQVVITTLPPAETVQAFVPATPTPTNTPSPTPTPTSTPIPTATPVGAATAGAPAGGAAPTPTPAGVPAVTHTLEGRDNCLMCHAATAAVPFPASHANFPVSTCLVCHSTQGVGPLPPAIKHSLEGRSDCLACHALDLLPASHQAAKFTSQDCLLCHAPQGAGTPTSPGAAAPGNVSFAADILPLFQANCATCHGEMASGGLKLTDYSSLAAGGQDGPAFVAGSPDQSLIVAKMKGEHSAHLAGADLQKLEDWIAAGAQSN